MGRFPWPIRYLLPSGPVGRITIIEGLAAKPAHRGDIAHVGPFFPCCNSYSACVDSYRYAGSPRQNPRRLYRVVSPGGHETQHVRTS